MKRVSFFFQLSFMHQPSPTSNQSALTPLANHVLPLSARNSLQHLSFLICRLCNQQNANIRKYVQCPVITWFCRRCLWLHVIAYRMCLSWHAGCATNKMTKDQNATYVLLLLWFCWTCPITSRSLDFLLKTKNIEKAIDLYQKAYRIELKDSWFLIVLFPA